MNRNIRLYNRDHANLTLEQVHDSDIWKLRIDDKHQYCLEYMRMGGDFEISEDNKIKWNKIVMIDPSGGPYLEIGDTLENGKYKIVEFIDSTTMRLSEGNNN